MKIILYNLVSIVNLTLLYVVNRYSFCMKC
jgi:hypothetical protein